MTDVWHKLMKFMDYERGKVIGLALALIIGLSVIGCDPKVANPFEPGGPKVSATELELAAIQIEVGLQKELSEYEALGVQLDAKVIAYNAQLEVGQDAIATATQRQNKFIEIAGGLATTLLTGGTVNAAGIIASLVTLAAVGAGAGAVVDKRRLNGIIADNNDSS